MSFGSLIVADGQIESYQVESDTVDLRFKEFRGGFFRITFFGVTELVQSQALGFDLSEGRELKTEGKAEVTFLDSDGPVLRIRCDRYRIDPE